MRSMLVIDRSANIARLFAEIFERRGWDVDTCSDRDSAIARIAGDSSYDVILLSYHVPGTNGVQLVRLIRAFEHRRMTAIVMVTACGYVSDEVLAAGADEVLLKPVNPNALVCVVDKLVT
jgi:DNA-binding response OmpR family regulator